MDWNVAREGRDVVWTTQACCSYFWFIYMFPVVASSFGASSCYRTSLWTMDWVCSQLLFAIKKLIACRAEVVLFSGIFVVSCESMLFYKESMWTCSSRFGFPRIFVQDKHLSSDLGLFHEVTFWSIIAPSSALGIYFSLLNSSAGLLLLNLKGKNCLTNF